jgi:hypothetical protein
LNEDGDLGILAHEDGPWPGKLLEDVAFGGRFALNEDGDLGVFAHEDGPWPDQLLEVDVAIGGRFELKLILAACVPGATALAKGAPDHCPVKPSMLRVLREPIEPTLRLPANAKLLFARGADPPNCLYERPLICRGATDPPRAKLLPPLRPPPPRWNPPPPPKWE